MHELSKEQKNILESVSTGSNIVVDAVAGTGKTTMILALAQEFSSKEILQLTYNKALKHEVKEKARAENLQNLSIQTYHSLAVKYYSSVAYVDNEIARVVSSRMPQSIPIRPFDILVIDEAQDMTLLYFMLVVKFTMDYGCPFQLIILGDYMQGLYQFKGSDARFLTFGHTLWQDHPHINTNTFIHCTMKTSYRITNQMRNFVNDALIGNDRMDSCREGEKVQYIRNASRTMERIACYEIMNLLENGAKPSDFFVLGPSVKGEKSPIRMLENSLVEYGIPCHVPMMESVETDSRTTEGKVVFSTFHSVKGRQRKYVFIVGFDNNYFQYYARTEPIGICPNTIYVACTRATERVYVMERNQEPNDRPFFFLFNNMSHIKLREHPDVRFRGHPIGSDTITIPSESASNATHKNQKMTPTKLIQFIPEETSLKICNIMDELFEDQTTFKTTIDIPGLIETNNGLIEEVNDINGIAIPAMYYDRLIEGTDNISIENTEDSILYDVIDFYLLDVNREKRTFLENVIDKLPKKISGISEYLFMANIHNAIQDSLYFRIGQITSSEYNWITPEHIRQCTNRMETVIGPDCIDFKPGVEQAIICDTNDDQHVKIDEFTGKIPNLKRRLRFTARVDLITRTTLWEIKCTASLTDEHRLQLVIYAWLYFMRDDTVNDEKRRFKLFNIKTGELLELHVNMEKLNTIMELLLTSRYVKTTPKTDDEFISDAKRELDNIVDHYELRGDTVGLNE